MTTGLTLRRLSAFMLVVILLLTGAPRPVHAGEEKSPVRSTRRHVLTLGGQPLSQIMAATPGTNLTGWREQNLRRGRSVSGGRVTRPARQRSASSRDSLWNGILIGAAVGVAAYYVALGAYCEGPCDFYPADGLLVSGGIGAGVGALIDVVR
jgi:hypothetical protein